MTPVQSALFIGTFIGIKVNFPSSYYLLKLLFCSDKIEILSDESYEASPTPRAVSPLSQEE